MWRSILFVPVLQEKFLAKAAERGADAIVLDLEASIAAERKDEARAALPAAVDRLTSQGQNVLVRVNMLWLAAVKDLEVAARAGVKAVVLPGCSCASDVKAVDGLLGDLEASAGLPQGEIGLIPLLETARGVLAAAEIAAASPRVLSLTFGVEDYLTDMEANEDRALLTMTALSIAQAARAVGKAPLVVPESLANLTDLNAFEAAAERGRAMGSCGGFAVHPAQVAVLNKVFRPSPEEIDWARRVVAAAQEAESAGLGAVAVDGRMIDLPIVLRAQKLLARQVADGG